jgi:hypothetical protein
VAKGQKKTNKEVRKPKKGKTSIASPDAPLFANGSLTSAGAAKKKT